MFLFNGVSPDVLPAELKQDLLARGAQGKGLVTVLWATGLGLDQRNRASESQCTKEY